MASEIVPSSKRPASPPANGALVVKRQRTDGELGTAEQVGPLFVLPPAWRLRDFILYCAFHRQCYRAQGSADSHCFHGLQPIKRTSSLRAPIMLLTGHSSEVFTLKFSPSGNLLACEDLHACCLVH